MAKLLLLVLLVAVGWLAYRFLRGSPPRARPDPAASPEAMVACARCGVAIPESESVTWEGKPVCRDPAQCRPPT